MLLRVIAAKLACDAARYELRSMPPQPERLPLSRLRASLLLTKLSPAQSGWHAAALRSPPMHQPRAQQSSEYSLLAQSALRQADERRFAGFAHLLATGWLARPVGSK